MSWGEHKWQHCACRCQCCLSHICCAGKGAFWDFLGWESSRCSFLQVKYFLILSAARHVVPVICLWKTCWSLSERRLLHHHLAAVHANKHLQGTQNALPVFTAPARSPRHVRPSMCSPVNLLVHSIGCHVWGCSAGLPKSANLFPRGFLSISYLW